MSAKSVPCLSSFLRLSVFLGLGLHHSSVQFSSVAQSWRLLATLWSAACQASLSITDSLNQTHVHGVGDAIQPSNPLFPLLLPPSIFLPASGSFPMSQFLTSGDQSIGVSASASVLPVNIQD